jgi:uncharacterized cupin superfamily protein
MPASQHPSSPNGRRENVLASSALIAANSSRIGPHALAAPLHRHENEDEYSFVLEGTLGALLGDGVVSAGPGCWVYKPIASGTHFGTLATSPAALSK